MSFSTEIKNEICLIDATLSEDISLLSAFIRNNGLKSKEKIELITENPKVARKIFSLLKSIYDINPLIEKGKNNNFNKKSFYNVVICEKVNLILSDLMVVDASFNYQEEVKEYLVNDEELARAYLKGVFLATGSINDPKTSRYHLEFLIDYKSEANFVLNLLKRFNIKGKIIPRDKGYMLYVKEAEKIGDFLRLLNANIALLYYEDIRIYRDHKNMTNRLNNCEQANVDKIIATSEKQINDIKLIKESFAIELIDPKLLLVMDYRIKYPDYSLNELSQKISEDTNKFISKSGLNHRFRKISELANKLKED